MEGVPAVLGATMVLQWWYGADTNPGSVYFALLEVSPQRMQVARFRRRLYLNGPDQREVRALRC